MGGANPEITRADIEKAMKAMGATAPMADESDNAAGTNQEGNSVGRMGSGAPGEAAGAGKSGVPVYRIPSGTKNPEIEYLSYVQRQVKAGQAWSAGVDEASGKSFFVEGGETAAGLDPTVLTPEMFPSVPWPTKPAQPAGTPTAWEGPGEFYREERETAEAQAKRTAEIASFQTSFLKQFPTLGRQAYYPGAPEGEAWQLLPKEGVALPESEDGIETFMSSLPTDDIARQRWELQERTKALAAQNKEYSAATEKLKAETAASEVSRQRLAAEEEQRLLARRRIAGAGASNAQTLLTGPLGASGGSTRKTLG